MKGRVTLEMSDSQLFYGNDTEIWEDLYAGSEVYLDTSLYDGASYRFEAVFTNDTGYNVTLEIMNEGGGIEADQIFGQFPTPTRWDLTQTPNNSYKRKRPLLYCYPGTEANAIIFAARIIVIQDNATKTELQIAIGTQASAKVTSYPSGSSNFGSAKRKFWYYDSSAFSTSGTMTVEMEAIIATASTANTVYGCVKVKGATSALTNGEVSWNTDTSIVRLRNTGGISLTNGTEYEGDYKGSASNKYSYVYAVRFFIRMTATISKWECYRRVGLERDVTDPSVVSDNRRRIYWAAGYTGTPTIYYESTGYESSVVAGNSSDLRSSVNDVDVDGSTVSGSPIDYASTSPIRKRTNSISLTLGYRYYSRVFGAGGQTVYLAHGWLVIKTTEAVVTETIIAKDFPMSYLEKPVKAEQLTSKVEGATVQAYTKNFPRRLVKAGKQKELESEFTA